jgi:hypothetical protein
VKALKNRKLKKHPEFQFQRKRHPKQRFLQRQFLLNGKKSDLFDQGWICRDSPLHGLLPLNGKKPDLFDREWICRGSLLHGLFLLNGKKPDLLHR